MSTAVLKDPALQQYYEALFTMYAMPGWRFLMEDVANMVEANDRVTGIENEQQLWLRHGSLQELRFFLNHQRNVETAYAQLLSEQEGKPEEAPTGGIARVVAADEAPE